MPSSPGRRFGGRKTHPTHMTMEQLLRASLRHQRLRIHLLSMDVPTNLILFTVQRKSRRHTALRWIRTTFESFISLLLEMRSSC